MKLRVLGCFGAEMPGYKVTSFLINEDTLLDAGTVVSSLTLEEQMKIKNVIISHTHLDHIKDILFLADNLIGKGLTVNIISAPYVLDSLKSHILNDAIWPDFTMLPTIADAVLKLVPAEVGAELSLGDITIKPVNVNHTVPAVGYIIKNKNSAFVYTGDTGPTDAIWEEAKKEPNLKFIIVEASFPNSMENIANASKHMTSYDLVGELKKLGKSGITVYVTHMKPQYLDIIKNELKAVNDLCSCISVLELGEVIEF
ncbi:MAG: 3',5'-cyclic-nucleotide phosphodiesterase [Deltaproteobacteria bacterium]|nr:3',5'-cyclic-nucleotide phosphodiesterase [Deltaproteobacteria bacterium]